MVKYLIFIIYILCSSSALILMKSDIGITSINLVQPAVNIRLGYKVILGAILYIVSFLMSLWLMSKFKLSLMYPIAAGMINVLVCILSITVLKESIGIVSWLGILLISLGVVILNIGK
ncbi:MAG: hypothetical protein Ta2F_02140 [Termitinemataceae bacterium]|nr:MAG: hypothetical protein Ta2F_02140 [Termitinemataceae bacterium]